MKVLVSAYACEPSKGSEPEVGWQWVRQIARFHETCVITRSNNRARIEEGLASDPAPNLNFVYIDLPKWARFWKRGNRGVHAYYYLWQMFVYLRARKLVRHNHFDVVQHITFVNMYMGPWLSLLETPFIWGPMGANPDIPKEFYPLIGSSGVRDNRLRFFIRKISPLIDPMIHIGQRKARYILTINKEIRSRLTAEIRPKSVILSQNGIDKKLLSGKPKEFCRPLRILSVGQLVSIKGCRLSLTAFQRHLSCHPESRLEIIGDGPLKSELIQLTIDLGVSNSVLFTGRINRDSVLQSMDENAVFLFPSFEAAGMVVIEAMAKGMPVVCLDFGGPGEYVTDKCGIRVPLTKPEAVIQGLADALSRLASDPDLYQQLSAGALERVRENYLWDQVGDRLNSLYRKVYEETNRG